MPLKARIARLSQDDWLCAAVCNVFSKDFYDQLVRGLDGLEWAEAVQSFYRQREVNLNESAYYVRLFDEQVRIRIAGSLGAFFGVRLSANFDVAAHKMITGDCIGVHTDANAFGETHRMTVTLNDGWSIAEGGVLLALNNGTLASVRDAWLPTANNGFLFEISETSYHAVTPIVGPRPRYSLILTFKCDDQGSASKQIWTPFALQSDLVDATSTAGHMGISAGTFDAGYHFIEFNTVDALRAFVGGHLENTPARWSYSNGTSINVDEHGRQSKGTDENRIEVVQSLRRIPPVIVVRRKSGRCVLVDGSHRLSYANDNGISVGVAVFDER